MDLDEISEVRDDNITIKIEEKNVFTYRDEFKKIVIAFWGIFK